MPDKSTPLHSVPSQTLETKEINVGTAGLVFGAFGLGLALGAFAVAKAGDKSLPTTKIQLGVPPLIQMAPAGS